MERPRKIVFITAALAGSMLLLALWGGLARLGWVAAAPAVNSGHGALMVSGFLGTLISLERAVALEQRAFMLVPAAAAAGGFSWLLLPGPTVAQSFWVVAGLGMVLMFVHIYRRQRAVHNVVIATGAALWLLGNLLWLSGWSLTAVVPWWAAFLIFTIVGERLELSRLRRPGKLSRGILLAALTTAVIGLGVAVVNLDLGIRLLGLGFLAQALWLLREDIVWRTITMPEPTRYIAYCLLMGYLWLGVGGGLWLWAGPHSGSWLHDAVLHALFLGFVMSMIFGHAIIILPAVLRITLPFRPFMYAPLVLLHASLIFRVVGDLTRVAAVVRWGGLFNIVAVLLFAATVLSTQITPVTTSR